MPNTLEELKVTTFDPILSQIVAVRVIYKHQITEYYRHVPIIKKILPIIVKLVNPAVINLIRGGELDTLTSNYSKSSKKNYLPEDKLKAAIRCLVEFEHGRNDRIKARGVTDRCMRLVEFIVNSEEFDIQLRNATKGFI